MHLTPRPRTRFGGFGTDVERPENRRDVRILNAEYLVTLGQLCRRSENVESSPLTIFDVADNMGHTFHYPRDTQDSEKLEQSVVQGEPRITMGDGMSSNTSQLRARCYFFWLTFPLSFSRLAAHCPAQ